MLCFARDICRHLADLQARALARERIVLFFQIFISEHHFFTFYKSLLVIYLSEYDLSLEGSSEKMYQV